MHAGAFGIIAILFLFPFLDASCADQETAENLGAQFALGGEGPHQTFAGWELVTGRERLVPQGLQDQDFIPGERFHVPAEPFAQIAFVATLVGLVFSFQRRLGTRELGNAISATVVAASLWFLFSSASLRKAGLFKLTAQPAYWGALLIALVIAGWSWRNWYLAKDSASTPTVDRSPRPRPPPMPPPH
ncbi:MAG: hypothetical protein ACRDI3_08130 [Actinomycetota bacterium]